VIKRWLRRAQVLKQAFGAVEQEHMMSPDGTKLLLLRAQQS